MSPRLTPTPPFVLGLSQVLAFHQHAPRPFACLTWSVPFLICRSCSAILRRLFQRFPFEFLSTAMVTHAKGCCGETSHLSAIHQVADEQTFLLPTRLFWLDLIWPDMTKEELFFFLACEIARANEHCAHLCLRSSFCGPETSSGTHAMIKCMRTAFFCWA